MAYDGVGNRTRLQWSANTSGAGNYFVTYNYDALNRLTEIDENGSANNPLAKYQWDGFSRLTSITYGDGTTDAYSAYDARDNLLTLSQSFTGGQNNVTFSYAWEKNHQRQSVAVNNGAFQYIPFTGTASYGAANTNNGYTSVGGVGLTYDTNANLTSDGFNTLTYDVENRLIQAQNGAHGTSQYLYDPLGHRKQKANGTVTTQFVLAGDEEIADFSGTGVGTAQLLTVRGVGGLPVAEVAPGSPETIQYYHHDVLGSTVAETAAGQNGAEAITYGEFGKPGAGYAFTYGCAGYRYDTETGLYYVRARYYSPDLGRFLQTDPIGLAGGANLYGYVGNDPVDWTDPDGRCPWCIGAVLGGVVGAAGQGISDLVSGHLSSWQTYAGATAGGAAGGAALFLTANPWAAGAAASLTQNLVTQTLNIATGQQKSFSGTSLVTQTLVGTVATGLLGTAASEGAFPGLTNSYTSLSKQMLTKLGNGTISDMLDTTAVKTFVGQADQWAPVMAITPFADALANGGKTFLDGAVNFVSPSK